MTDRGGSLEPRPRVPTTLETAFPSSSPDPKSPPPSRDPAGWTSASQTEGCVLGLHCFPGNPAIALSLTFPGRPTLASEISPAEGASGSPPLAPALTPHSYFWGPGIGLGGGATRYRLKFNVNFASLFLAFWILGEHVSPTLS